MNSEILKSAGVNYEEGLKRFSGREDLYEKYLKKFAEDENFNLCREDMKTGDVEAAFTHSHALKGLTGNLSMNQFYGQLEKVVEALRAKDKERADEYFVELEKQYDELLVAIEAAKN